MILTSLLLPAVLLATPNATATTSGSDWTIFCERVYTAPGEVVENAAVHVSNGKIRSIVAAREPREGDNMLRAASLTAGMIDASARINTGLTSVEQSSEVTPQLRVAHAIDPFDVGFDRQLRSGVTTVLCTPMDRNVIGGYGVVLKTGGAASVEARTLRADAVVRGAIGTDPSAGNSPATRSGPVDFFKRRPTTRMGVEWEWRKAFYDAAAATRLPEREFPGADVLRSVLAGETPLCIQAWATQDIRTAVFLKEEMQREGLGDIQLMIDAAAEVWLDPQLVVRSKTAVILPPFPANGRVGPDRAFMSWNAAKILVDQGVQVALSSHGAASSADLLGLQAGYAMRGGLSFDEALASVTTTPAALLGVTERVGSIESGKDADLVLWSGTPFEATSRVIGVLLDGELALDPRKTN